MGVSRTGLTSRAAFFAAAVALLAGSTGCGRVERSGGSKTPPKVVEESSRGSAQRRPTETVAPSHCPTERPGCRSADGRIVYVERVDPDGDGDAHFVILDSQGITLPGLTAIDVRKGLRPHPLPAVGDLISTAGPIETGSYGQSQIHALELHVGHRH